MSELLVSFYPGWVHSKNSLTISTPFQEIIKFFLWGTPCEETSSSGLPMRRRGWSKNVWKSSSELRAYLLFVAKLKSGKNLKKANRINCMSDAATAVGLGSGTFHSVKDYNRVVFYNNGDCPDMLSIFYYIRCALAHGRFEIHAQPELTIYVFEAVLKKRQSSDYSVRARMILSEDTLLTWKTVIEEGEVRLSSRLDEMKETIQSDIVKIITDRGHLHNKHELIEALPMYDETTIFSHLNNLRKNGVVDYQNKQWKVL